MKIDLVYDILVFLIDYNCYKYLNYFLFVEVENFKYKPSK